MGLRGEQDTAAFVLAGGNSSRMGRDKALVDFAGQPLIVRALDILRAAGLSPHIAGAHSDLENYAPVVPDLEPGTGPLGGICAALHGSPLPRAVFVTVDMPLLPPSLIACMMEHARITENSVTLCSVNGFPQTFPAVLRRDCLPTLEAELRGGRLGCFSAFQAAALSLKSPSGGGAVSVLPVEVLAQVGRVSPPGGQPPARWFSNVNSPADLERALKALA